MLLNVTPDHLDRHGSSPTTSRPSSAIFANQRPDDVAVLPRRPRHRGRRARPRAGAVRGRAAADLRLGGGGLGWDGSRLVALDELPLPGAHNLQNAMAAAAACLARGLDPGAVADGLRSFRGVAHRLEPVAERGGVAYVNDSKATNVASTLVALRSYPGGVHLIARRAREGAGLRAARAARARALRRGLSDRRGRRADRRGARATPACPCTRPARSSAALALARGPPAPARSCCSRRPARASTSSATSRSAASSSAGSSRRWDRMAAPRQP